MNHPFSVGSVRVGGDTLTLIAGPCGLESLEVALEVARTARDACATHGIGYIFKSSFDKANRTRIDSWRGPGLEAGLAILARVREVVGCPVTTDIHHPEQAAIAAEVVDMLQIPAFLCRQTDLLVAAAATGRPVNVKKGQFVAPDDMPHVLAKLEGASGAMITERGTTFGHRDLVVDFRGLVTMRQQGFLVCFDASHAVRQPSDGTHTSAPSTYVPALARAAVATGVDALFVETHPHPSEARSDATTQLPLAHLSGLLAEVAAIRAALSRS